MAKSNGKSRLLPNGRFLSIPHAVVDTAKFRNLSPWAVHLLVDLTRQHNGFNNGSLAALWSQMKERGWKSKGTLHRATLELVEAGFIEQTQQGGRHRPNLYALTWHPIDEIKDSTTRTHKLDVRPTKRASGLWHD